MHTVSRNIYGLNPVPEYLEVARCIRERTGDADSILVFGSEPQIYFYSGRRSASSYIFTYALIRPHDYAATMQGETIQQVQTRQPEFVVYVNVSTSWMAGADADRNFFDWFVNSELDKYVQVGLIDLLGQQDTRYCLDADEIDRFPKSRLWLTAHKRL